MTWLILPGLVLAVYLGLAISIYRNQDRLLYIPTTYDLQALQEGCQTRDLTPWPTQDEQYLGLLSSDRQKSTAGTVLVFHGNAGTALGRDYYVQTLAPMGYRVILVEYPAYGAKPGTVGETSLVTSGQQALERAVQDFGEPVYVISESMGCGVACAVAARMPQHVHGLLLITPWDSLPNLAQQLYPAYPARWLVRDRYDNISNCQALTCPIGIVMAEHDEVIPNQRTLNLVQALGDYSRQWTLNAGHNDWFDHTSHSWWQEVMAHVTGKSFPSTAAPDPATPQATTDQSRPAPDEESR